ncbi:phospholipid:diacylglycerol acyltransferase-like protein, putative [Trypanosoma brucei gambiense DAL972]|uniref:Phospholipid:diacylglycerol acyltransferase-like protein, putative n=2 Tax=Trypanosoma brucei TaxID=5691 RepID=D0A9K5_TRYB9|nr:phospholipid:diacylglycerol acyltransferase-like protein, putative [Trypanosoma brucei gambiense DAL972]RHW68203.1 phospholipid:diacylglycerol acyltransferase-like protein [Trypanosoma brucei equiperdum]CBH18356.1 phospholipid:diacylglycerol acyltransferase-like protein, putative [Trypanosoma brucei gambiense DAL972]|eukprot:XP_011780620.1 phospholipid:diacylglycerol acyltransferase-like protein, putative [Trypanosoma brucei gambiense DAL972]
MTYKHMTNHRAAKNNKNGKEKSHKDEPATVGTADASPVSPHMGRSDGVEESPMRHTSQSNNTDNNMRKDVTRSPNGCDCDEGSEIAWKCQSQVERALAMFLFKGTARSSPADDVPVLWDVGCDALVAAKRPVMYLIDFFTRRRVMFVFLVIAVLLGYHNFQEEISSLTDSFVVADADRPGVRFLQNHTMRRKHPVMIIPGFISTALEVWQDVVECTTSQAYSSRFRQRMFGPSMLFLLATDPACYMKLFSLDKGTGFDPPGVKIRPDMGFGAADFFMPGYWVWAKIFVNLADIGYDPQSMGISSYDWRLSPRGIHRRDGYYYHLKNYLMYLYHKNEERVVIVSHSYGSLVVVDFLRWADEHEAGWTNKHVANWINIGGTTMGVSKTVSALLSGEAKDTLALPGTARAILENYFSRNLRTETFRTWSCQAAMLPSGCEGVHPQILRLHNGTVLPPKEAIRLLTRRLNESGHVAVVKQAREVLGRFGKRPNLPKAPNTTVFCLYGVDRKTEIGYVLGEDEAVDDTYNEGEHIVNGVINGDGDGTVPLLSLGYMCRAKNGWKRDVGRVITREHKHSSGSSMNLRGGSSSGDHVDILGNHELVWTILKVVSGNAEEGELSDRIYSNIDEKIEQSGDCLLMEGQ